MDFVINQKTGNKETCYMRKLNKKDIENIIVLQNKIILSLDDPNLFAPFMEHEFEHLFKNKDNIVLGVFTDDNKLIAFRAATVEGKEFDEVSPFLDEKYAGSNKMLLNGAFVDEDYRKNRLQTKMSRHTLSLAHANHINVFFTVIHPDNIASIKSIEALGFKAIKEIDVYSQSHRRILFLKGF
jgi:RimJ/RimL family protein N-acetyltransferase